MEGKPSKQQLLDHYARKPVTEFTQIDGFWLHGRDDVLKPDELGRAVMTSQTYELMSTRPDVRVLVPGGTSRERLCSLLQRILNDIEASAPIAPGMPLEEY